MAKKQSVFTDRLGERVAPEIVNTSTTVRSRMRGVRTQSMTKANPRAAMCSLKTASIGNGPETLQRVDMVGNNLAHGPGVCGSVSGMIPVNVGQPMLRVCEMTVGGTKGEA